MVAMQKLKKRSGHKCLKDTDDCTISNPLPVAGNLKWGKRKLCYPNWIFS